MDAIDISPHRGHETSNAAAIELLGPTDQPRCAKGHDPFASTRFVGNERRQRFFRRKYRIDRWVGMVLLVLTSPLTLLLYGVVRLSSPGPGFYRQRRVGLHGELFDIVKLRSMVQHAERDGRAVWCVQHDARITPLGRLLRRLHLDELPQLWNVARGEMALVGPRPERPQICRKLATEIEGYYQRVAVKPGITGLAQINLPPDESLEDVVRKQILDLRYIEEANAWLEFRIVVATALRMLGIRGEAVMHVLGLDRRQLLAWGVGPGKTGELCAGEPPANDSRFGDGRCAPISPSTERIVSATGRQTCQGTEPQDDWTGPPRRPR